MKNLKQLFCWHRYDSVERTITSRKMRGKTVYSVHKLVRCSKCGKARGARIEVANGLNQAKAQELCKK